MTLFLGIDPGLSGAICFFDPAMNWLRVHDMPTHSVKSNGKNKRKIDLHAMADIVRGQTAHVSAAVVEQVGAMPGQGVTSMFSFGFSAGCAQMLVAALQIPLTLVTPRVWKAAMRITNNKDDARRAASRLMPAHAHNWPLVKHDGRAEAALLCYWLTGMVASPVPEPKQSNIEEML